MKPEILFEDPHLIIVSKPAGLLSQGDHSKQANVVDWLRGYLGRPYVGLIHRLDRNVSGLMVVAKRSKAAARLTRALQDGEVSRVYRAWLLGRLERPVRWRHWLLKDEKSNRVRVFKEKTGRAKEAVLGLKPLEEGAWRRKPVTLVEIKLETGRSHQIRAQAAFEGHPVLGDVKYAAKDTFGKHAAFKRIALHAAVLKLPHPMSHEVLTFRAPLPETMQRLTARELPPKRRDAKKH